MPASSRYQQPSSWVVNVSPGVDRDHKVSSSFEIFFVEYDVECVDGETILATDGCERIPGIFYVDESWLEVLLEEEQVPEFLLGSYLAYSYPAGYKEIRQSLNDHKKARGFFQPAGSAPSSSADGHGRKGKSKGKGKNRNRMQRMSIEQVKLRTKCARCSTVGQVGLPAHATRAGLAPAPRSCARRSAHPDCAAHTRSRAG